MKNVLIIILIIFATHAQAQKKGFYFNIGINALPYKGVYFQGSGNVGYCFGVNTISAHSMIGYRLTDAIGIEHNANIKLGAKTYLYSILGFSFASDSHLPNSNKKLGYDFAEGRAVNLGIGCKYYVIRKYAITTSCRVHLIKSQKGEYPIQRPQNLSPITFGLGFGK